MPLSTVAAARAISASLDTSPFSSHSRPYTLTLTLPPLAVVVFKHYDDEIIYKSMEKFICIHGHFYQPPRENPWLESGRTAGFCRALSRLERTHHCRMLRAECHRSHSGRRRTHREIVSNYSKISFNFGPTLLAWMKDKMPEIHEAIVAADKLSRRTIFRSRLGHGPGLQSHDPALWPIVATNIRRCSGASAISNIASAAIRKECGSPKPPPIPKPWKALAELGIKFTILSPFQASRVREIGKRIGAMSMADALIPRAATGAASLGTHDHVFFYDAPVSQAVAFEKLLDSGERFAQRLMSAFNDGAIGISWSISPPMASLMGIIIVMVKWRWLMPSIHREQINSRG